MARTMLIGLRREPQPPMPIVMPSRSSRDDVFLGDALVGHSVRVPVTTRTCRRRGSSTNASRSSSDTPARLSSKVKPCSKR